MTKGFEAVIEVLRTEGVGAVFTYMSEDNMELLSEIHDHHSDEIDIVHSRHEQGAVGMADGYWRTTGKIGVCTVGRGPAVAQTGTGLVTARKRGSRVLVIVPEPAFSSTFTARDLDSKDFEQRAFLQDTIGNVIRVKTPEKLVPDTREAFRQLHVNSGPVALQVPRDILNGDIGDVDLDQITPSYEPSPSTVQPSQADIDAAVELFLDSDVTKVPVIIAGMGAAQTGAKDAILELAEQMNAVLATSLLAQGYFSDHDFATGFTGDYGSNLANKYVAQADFVLGIGCSLNSHTTDSGSMFEDDTKIVHVDANPAAIEEYTNVDIGIVGDATLTANAIREELENMGIDRSGTFWTDSLREEIKTYDPFETFSQHKDSAGIDPWMLIAELNDLIPENRLVVSDGGQTARWILDGIEVRSAGNFIWPVDFAAIGQALPVSLGAAYASTEPCYAFIGDGAFLMVINELESAVREHIPVTIFVLNDEALGMEYHKLKTVGYDGSASQLATPDLATLADAFGADGYSVESLDDLHAIEDVITSPPDGPVVVDCAINVDVYHP